MPTASLTSEWHQRVDRLTADRPLDLVALVQAIQEGIAIRRKLDALADSSDQKERRGLFARLFTLQQQVIDGPSISESDGALHRVINEQVTASVHTDQAYLSDLLTHPDLSPVSRAVAVEAFRFDLYWTATLILRLEDKSIAEPIVAAQLRLDQVRNQLEPFRQTLTAEHQSAFEAIVEQIRVLESRLCVQRTHEELAQPIDALTPRQLWERRLALSRLQIEVESLLTPDSSDENGTALAEETQARRHELSATLRRQLNALSGEAQKEAWPELVAVAGHDFNETRTFLEDLSLAKGIKRLENSHEDLEELIAVGGAISTNGQRDARSDKELRRYERWVRAELQEKRLARRMERLFGRRTVGWLENTILVLILGITALIFLEWALESMHLMTPALLELFAWLDLTFCTVFLADFFLRLSLVEPVPSRATTFLAAWPGLQARWLYLKQPRNFIVGFLASIPFGFIAHQLTSLSEASQVVAENANLARLARFLRLPRLARYIRVARPFIRLLRLFLFVLRGADQLVQRYASVFNRNIVLFESEQAEDPEARGRHQLVALREHFRRRAPAVVAQLSPDDRMRFFSITLADLHVRIDTLPEMSRTTTTASSVRRQITAERVIERLTEMTPDQLLDEMGPSFVDSVARYLRLFDVPLIRRIPGVRNLVELRAVGTAEAAALATNYVGYLLQGILNIAYYFADLQGTMTAPVFVDRLGSAIVKATARPARRLLMLGGIVLFLYLLVLAIHGDGPAPTPADSTVIAAAGEQAQPAEPFLKRIFRSINRLLGTPVIALGIICLLLWSLGAWLRRVANRATEFCERVVEAQFAAQTKAIKQSQQSADMEFISDRVLKPEIELRACDDRTLDEATASRLTDTIRHIPVDVDWRSEHVFMRNVRLLYHDYLDGSHFHRSDTKTTTQLLGNLALANLRNSNLHYALKEAKRLETLDLARAGTLFGGPYLWFNYITQLITQETAKLIIDYNRNAIPLIRLACSPRVTRERYREWLSQRLGIAPESVELPAPVGPWGDAIGFDRAAAGSSPALYETVEFTAMDFLTVDAARDAELTEKYGAQLVELLGRMRRQIVRKAFRSLPLERVPVEKRTVNFFVLYQTYCHGGRIVLLPFVIFGWVMRLVWYALRRITRVVIDIVKLQVQEDPGMGVDNYHVARRKIHRMRKPVFMESLWLRARFDVEYLGLPLPGIPLTSGNDSLLEMDLDFIGASRRDRLAAERILKQQDRRLEWTTQWLRDVGLQYETLPATLEREYPFLADRTAEVVRALVTAFILDYDDIYSLASSIEGTRRVLEYLQHVGSDFKSLPEGLPDLVNPKLPRWYPPAKPRRPLSELFDMPRFSGFDRSIERWLRRYVRRHRPTVGGWFDLLLSQGGPDPVETLRGRLNDIIRRCDLWSDEIIALRTIQTLTLLDVYHYCEMVWNLGGYQELHPEGIDNYLPLSTGLVNRAESTATPASSPVAIRA